MCLISADYVNENLFVHWFPILLPSQTVVRRLNRTSLVEVPFVDLERGIYFLNSSNIKKWFTNVSERFKEIITFSMKKYFLLFFWECTLGSELWSHGIDGMEDGRPLVVAHKGASGVLPAHSVEAYQLAIDSGNYWKFILLTDVNGEKISS